MATLRHALGQVLPLLPAADRIGRACPAVPDRAPDLVMCLAAGNQNRGIADHLATSEQTVRNLLTWL